MKAIMTEHLLATNTRGARIAASDGAGNRVTIPYPYELSGMDVHAEAAIALCRKMGWTGRLHGGGLGDRYVFVFESQPIVIGGES